jgi:hypothetical protein
MEGSGQSLIELFPQKLPGGTEANHKKKPVIIASILAEIQTEDLPNTNLQLYL